MANLEALETWLLPLLQKLDGRGRAQLARKAAQQLRRSQQQRIRDQANPDGSAFEPRKQSRLRHRQGKLRWRMFEKIHKFRYLKAIAGKNQLSVGFINRTSQIARVHQYGLSEKSANSKIAIRYPKRILLGLTQDEKVGLRNLFMDELLNSYDQKIN